MNFLTDNPIANMRGPEFLVLYAFVAIGVIIWAFLRSQAAEESRNLEEPQLPTEFDPFEIAYLRGGTPEFTRLIIFDLITRKYLESLAPQGLFGSRKIRVPSTHPDPKYLDGAERVVFEWMRSGRKADEIFPALSTRLEGNTAEYRNDLESRQLLMSEEQRSKIWRAVSPAWWMLGGLTAYKLCVALSRGKTNVIFLIIMTVIALVVLLLVTRPKRLTQLGRDYFARIQAALGMLKERMAQLTAGNANDHLVLGVGTFGISALAGTRYDYYPEMFKKASQQNSSGCGSGCGSSCGSSCGGGCGGGGCGGCGG